MKVMSINDIQKLIKIIGLKAFLTKLILFLESDFARWDTFHKSVRHATYFAQGAIELMPCANDQFYAFKYVNRYPGNTAQGKLSVIGIGQLSDAATGYPLLLSEMTLLTALRTAATGALAAKYLAREEARSLAIIGTGAQAEFQVIAFNSLFPLQQIRYFDIDPAAMAKFSRNLASYAFELIPCANVREAIHNTDIIITATATTKRMRLFELQDVATGSHIHAMGGDSPGKTELSQTLLKAAKIVVEFIPQTLKEGEVQQCDASDIYAELWELVTKRKRGRENATEITVFDSVGFAVEDFSVLRLVYELSLEHQLGSEIALLPEPDDPKDLFSVLIPFLNQN